MSIYLRGSDDWYTLCRVQEGKVLAECVIGSLDVPGKGDPGWSDSVRGKFVPNPLGMPPDRHPWAPEGTGGGSSTLWYDPCQGGWAPHKLIAWSALRGPLPHPSELTWDLGSSLYLGLEVWAQRLLGGKENPQYGRAEPFFGERDLPRDGFESWYNGWGN